MAQDGAAVAIIASDHPLAQARAQAQPANVSPPEITTTPTFSSPLDVPDPVITPPDELAQQPALMAESSPSEKMGEPSPEDLAKLDALPESPDIVIVRTSLTLIQMGTLSVFLRGGRTLSVAAWNSRFTNTDAHDRDSFRGH
jgi:hypothetical protein